MQVATDQGQERSSLSKRFNTWLNQEHILGPTLVAPAVLILIVLIAYPFSVGVLAGFYG